MTAPILFDTLAGKAGDLGIITLNRPNALHALNYPMVQALDAQLQAWANTPHIKAVIITAAPSKAFCAGGDLRAVYEDCKAHNLTALQFFRSEYHLNQRIFHYPKPYIAFLDGITMGGGAGISLHGAVRIGTEKLLFAMPETGIGFYPDVGGTYFLPRLAQAMGIYLGLTGARIQANDCHALGLIQHKIASTDIPQVMQALCATALPDVAAVNKVLQTFNSSAADSQLLRYAASIKRHFMHEHVDDIMQSLQDDDSEFAEATYQLLQTKSPTSLKVTLHALLQGKNLSFDDCMQQEFRLTSRMIFAHDFVEGIRAVIIDKDQQPQWQPPTLNAVSDATVMNYFQALAVEL